MNKPASQTEKIMRHLNKGRSISSGYAFEKFGIVSLQRRLFEIRRAGVSLDWKWIKMERTQYKSYKLAK